MRHYVIIATTLLFCIGNAKAQDVLWEKSYGGKHDEILNDVLPTPDYGFIIAGSSMSNKNGNKEIEGKGNLDYWIWKMDQGGNLDWQKSFGGDDDDVLESIILTKDGGFLLSGVSNSNKSIDKFENSKGEYDLWIIKLNANGEEMWQKTIGGNGNEKLATTIRTKEGGYLIAGSSSSYAFEKNETQKDEYNKTEDTRGNSDYWVVNINDNGKIIWQKTIGGEYFDELKCAIQTKDGNFLIGGNSNSNAVSEKTNNNIGALDIWLLKIDKTGNIVWQNTIGGNANDQIFSLAATPDNGFIVGAISNSDTNSIKTKSSSDGTDFWVLKFNENYEIQWQETYNYGKNDVLTTIVSNTDGTYYIGGYAQSEKKQNKTINKIKSDKEGINDYIIVKINAVGEKIWDKTIGSNGDEVLSELTETRDGGYLLCGTTQGSASGDKNNAIGRKDFWVVKLKDRLKLEKPRLTIEALPNPAQTFSNIIVNFNYTQGDVYVYDLNGRIIQQAKLSGDQTIPINFTNLPQGLYIVNVVTNGGHESVKVIKN